MQRALAYAVTLLGRRPEAEDVVQDCYARLLAKADRYDLVRDGNRLLFKSITNACINVVQRRPPTVNLGSLSDTGTPHEQQVAARPDEDPQRRVLQRELEEAVGDALAELPVKQRAAVELRSLGYSTEDLAEMLDVSLSNARVLLHRARQALARRLQPYLEERVK